jgi:hypothetical protein
VNPINPVEPAAPTTLFANSQSVVDALYTRVILNILVSRVRVLADSIIVWPALGVTTQPEIPVDPDTRVTKLLSAGVAGNVTVLLLLINQ